METAYTTCRDCGDTFHEDATGCPSCDYQAGGSTPQERIATYRARTYGEVSA